MTTDSANAGAVLDPFQAYRATRWVPVPAEAMNDTATDDWADVRAWLGGRTVALVGMMGVGKTTIGRRLAGALDLPFRDADHEIERAAAMSVVDIFATLGEAEFRRGERRVVARLLGGAPLVLSTGEGAFLDAQTRALMRDRAYTVWLKAHVDVLTERVTRRTTRPLINGHDAREVLTRLLDERAPIYAKADLTVETVKGPPVRVAQSVLEALRRRARG